MTNPHSSGESLIFPIGHYMGAFYPEVGAPVKYHRVRVGDRSVRLDTHDEVTVWALTHGVPDLAEHIDWTRNRVEELARDGGVAKPGRLIDDFLAEGILAEVTPGTADAIEFARGHRLQPLMVGMGNTAQDPSLFRIGYADRPALTIPSNLYELWEWGHLFDLWQACELFADVARDTRSPDPGSTDPKRILTGFLSSMHLLLSHSAAYLDQVVSDD